MLDSIKILEEHYKDVVAKDLHSAKEKWVEIELGRSKVLINHFYFNNIMPVYRTEGIDFYICRCQNNHYFKLRAGYLKDEQKCLCPICNNKILNRIGSKYNKLTIEFLNRIDGYQVYYNCHCDCGNKTVVSYDYLTRKQHSIKSCGCLQKESVAIHSEDELLNKKIGRLTILEKTNNKTNYGDYLYKCKCDCGNIKYIASRSLYGKKTFSCGCYHYEQVFNASANKIYNKRFGKLIALFPVKGDKDNTSKWHCKCDCGNEKDISTNSLISGSTISCGCLKMSKGEYFISQLLMENNIPFIREYTPKTLSFKGRYDFYVDNKYMIEFDGQQHYIISETGFFSDTEEFKKRQLHDKIKNQWCKENNIPLIRIPYTRLDNLCIDDLKLETSKFII